MTLPPEPAPGAPWGVYGSALRTAVATRMTDPRNIKDYGATTAGADNAAAIQGAINEAATAGGGVVLVPAGTWTTGPLQMKSRVHLIGQGWGSVLRLKNGANAHIITLATPQVEQIGIQTIRLDGNKTNQTTGNVVHLDNTGYNPDLDLPSISDPNHWLDRVLISNGKGAGLHNAGDRGQSQFRSVFSYHNDGYGIRITAPDVQVIDCVSGWAGLDGFLLNGNSMRVINPKSFLSGATFQAGVGAGFNVFECARMDLIGAEAQDNRWHGFALYDIKQLHLVGRADRNGIGPASQGSQGDGIVCNLITKSIIDLTSGDREELSFTPTVMQRWAYNCGSGNDRNIVRIAAGTSASGVAGVGSFGPNSQVTIT